MRYILAEDCTPDIKLSYRTSLPLSSQRAPGEIEYTANSVQSSITVHFNDFIRWAELNSPNPNQRSQPVNSTNQALHHTQLTITKP
ncbi:hypothetical protein E2C01_000067 [Portunus trituberculatus]|uniref:Uncharacterized protein n=1 Tax=Portunus trituberculatus TaxID=210409 RepID=A0A5B7CGB2_PORTR|nr:hypothetical protein [Portunus trituberculatus]